MALRRKVRQIGNSITLTIPNELFDFFGFEPKDIKYKLCQDDTGAVYIVILEKSVFVIDEKKFQKHGNSYAIIIPKPLCTMWNIGLSEGQNRELELLYSESPIKWRLSPV